MEKQNANKPFDNNEDNENSEKENKLKKKHPEYTKRSLIIITVCSVVLILIGMFFIINLACFQSTNDAVVEGNIISITPRVSGQVINLYAGDSLEVKANEILVEIDSKDYDAKLSQAENKLTEAKVRLEALEKQVNDNLLDVDSSMRKLNLTTSKLDFAEKDYTRYAEMYKEGIVSKQEYDKSLSLLTIAQTDAKKAENNHKAVKSVFEASNAKVKFYESEIKKLETEVEQAKINLSCTKIFAPENGMISVITVKKGDNVQIAQPIMSIVPQKMWVVANFNEIQAANMKKGQPVWIKVNTYPLKRFKGQIDNIQKVKDTKTSLLTSKDAVQGKMIKVKILFDEDLTGYNIVPGMSVGAKVKVR